MKGIARSDPDRKHDIHREGHVKIQRAGVMQLQGAAEAAGS